MGGFGGLLGYYIRFRGLWGGLGASEGVKGGSYCGVLGGYCSIMRLLGGFNGLLGCYGA